MKIITKNNHEKDKVIKSIKFLLKNNFLLTLCTTKNNQPYCKTSYYTYDNKFNLYIWTSQNSLNAKNINNIHFEQDIIATTKNLLNKDGKNIWLVGGAEIITVMLNNDFINEIILSIHPLILGRGIPLFKEIVKEIKMTLIKEIRYETGLLQAHYQVQ